MSHHHIVFGKNAWAGHANIDMRGLVSLDTDASTQPLEVKEEEEAIAGCRIGGEIH